MDIDPRDLPRNDAPVRMRRPSLRAIARSEESAYSDGVTCYLTGWRRTDNPHRASALLRDAWFEGFDFAAENE